MKLKLPTIDTKALVDALKELARIAMLAVVSFLLTGGLDTILGTVELSPELRLTIVGLLTSALRTVDKYLHERGKNTGNDGYLGTKGLTYI